MVTNRGIIVDVMSLSDVLYGSLCFLAVQAMWTATLEQCPCQVEDRFDLASVCLLSEGQSAASIQQVTQHFPANDPFGLMAADEHVHALSWNRREGAPHVCRLCSQLLQSAMGRSRS